MTLVLQEAFGASHYRNFTIIGGVGKLGLQQRGERQLQQNRPRDASESKPNGDHSRAGRFRDRGFCFHGSSCVALHVSERPESVEPTGMIRPLGIAEI